MVIYISSYKILALDFYTYLFVNLCKQGHYFDFQLNDYSSDRSNCMRSQIVSLWFSSILFNIHTSCYVGKPFVFIDDLQMTDHITNLLRAFCFSISLIVFKISYTVDQIILPGLNTVQTFYHLVLVTSRLFLYWCLYWCWLFSQITSEQICN